MAYANAADIKARKPFKWWHEKIIDDMIMFPLSTLQERCDRLGKYSPASLSLIINSDMFQHKYQDRRKRLSESLDDSILNKTQQCANKALDIMLETLEKKRDGVGFQALADFTDKTLNKLGYGAKAPANAVQVQINNGAPPPVSREQLEAARGKLRSVESQRLAHTPAKEPPQSSVSNYEPEAEVVVIDVECEDVSGEEAS